MIDWIFAGELARGVQFLVNKVHYFLDFFLDNFIDSAATKLYKPSPTSILYVATVGNMLGKLHSSSWMPVDGTPPPQYLTIWGIISGQPSNMGRQILQIPVARVEAVPVCTRSILGYGSLAVEAAPEGTVCVSH